MRLNLEGLDPETIRRIAVLVRNPGPREAVCLRLAAAMAANGEQSGARWIVRRLLDRRERQGRPD